MAPKPTQEWCFVFLTKKQKTKKQKQQTKQNKTKQKQTNFIVLMSTCMYASIMRHFDIIWMLTDYYQCMSVVCHLCVMFERVKWGNEITN